VEAEATSTDVQTDVRAIAERYGLGERAIDALTVFLQRVLESEGRGVLKWQDRAVARLGESLEALQLPEVRAAKDAADIGSGAGFPGLALAAALPETRMTLIEVKGNRCKFLRESIEAMALENVEVVRSRVQVFWAEGEGRFDLITSRGVSKVPVMVGLAAPLLKPGGTLVLWGQCKGRRNQTVTRGLGFVLAGTLESEGICLHTYTKLESPAGSAPAGVPRLQRADRTVPHGRDTARFSLPKCEARIAKLSEVIAGLEEARSRASDTQRPQLDLDIRRFVERRAALELQRARLTAPDPDGGPLERKRAHA
jgi:16S rRNA (guanine(527)-N(7))-methyltransferase RsmG